MNGRLRQELADKLAPSLLGWTSVSLRFARDLLHEIRPDLASEIDGMETAHILRRAGFTKDYSRPVGPSLYRRKEPVF